MSETNDEGETQKSAPVDMADGSFEIQKVYCKDLSFENPKAPGIFRGGWEPDVDIQIQTRATSFEKDLYDVVLTVTVTVKLDGEAGFLAEVQQAGIFAVTGLDRPRLDHVLGSYCPSILYPYAREAVSDVVTRGGYPQMLLAPVNFDAMYAEKLAKQPEKKPEQATDQSV